ncbi:GIY-YIG nuclease family protein [Neobacillus drentensis]|uniref:GIY-YIG nuclease family protein n=1 Tax=Neobacillus drentensis TaxID=220684 RepID=UPI001F484740|nr:GIY-YIG nuclease family protein [Neobacillus drentensis]ULT55008.1 GIY-YIG nuclease family protein [Neobacillus drentensis]
MKLKDKVKSLPLTPGVYLMKDAHGHIIYVGKAKSLKKRVQSYFQHSKAHTQKIKKMVSNIFDFDYVLTDTEFEAFLLECNLIKELKPHFNKKMKSPQSYIYLVIKMVAGKRVLEMASSIEENDGNLYFGPFLNKYTVERAITGIKDVFKINCSNPSMKHGPCLNYSLGLCMGVCLGGSALAQYNRILDKIIAFLNGTDSEILEEIGQKMVTASEQYQFEVAAKYRNILGTINALLFKEKVIEFTEANQTIVVVESLTESTFKHFLIKGNKVLYREILNNEQPFETIKMNLSTYLKQSPLNTRIVVSKEELDEAQIIYNYLKSGHCRYRIIPNAWLEAGNDLLIENVLEELLNEILQKESQNLFER